MQAFTIQAYIFTSHKNLYYSQDIIIHILVIIEICK